MGGDRGAGVARADVHGYSLHAPLPDVVWHAHEMVYGFGAAAVAGFLLTAIPNGPAARRCGTAWPALVSLWVAGRSATLGPGAGAARSCLPGALIAVVARELIAGGNWRNLPMLVALSLLFSGNALVHLHALESPTWPGGHRLGIATLLLAYRARRRAHRSELHAQLASEGAARHGRHPPQWNVSLTASPWRPSYRLFALAAWVGRAPFSAGCPRRRRRPAARLSRWRGLSTLREPLLFVLHAGYAWLALGLILLGLGAASGAAPHALTVGAIGTMTLAVMTRATLGHTGRALAPTAPPLRAMG